MLLVQFFRTVITWIFTAVFLSFILILSLLTFQAFAVQIWFFAARFWSKGCLWLVGVKLIELNTPTYEGAENRIIMTNHQSALDVLWICATSPPAFSSIAKKSFRYVPIVNLAFWASGQVFIDRKNSRKTLGILGNAMNYIKKNKRSLVILPEGTRSETGRIAAFKKGGFHMAVETGFPIHPVVVSGAYECMPPGSFIPRPGKIFLKYLPPINTQNWVKKDIPKHMEDTRGKICAAFDELEARL